jgi:tape measure domain-containing protein
MKFDNQQFERDAATTLSTLQKLKQSLSFEKVAGGAVKGLTGISAVLGKLGVVNPFTKIIDTAARGLPFVGRLLEKTGRANPFASAQQGVQELDRQSRGLAQGGLGAISGGITAINGKWLAMATVAITAISNITNKLINATTQWVKGFTVAPIMDGLREYEETLKSIQTVQANTDQPLPKIERALKDLNAYSDTTIYNFGEMAKNVGTFTAAGVNLKDSVASIKGIANVAALSGSSSQQAAGAMYQLSQAIAAGKVGAQDWNSVVNAGMAGKKLQTALATTAVAMGKLDKSAVTTNKSTGALMVNAQSFKNSIMALPGNESWLSSDVLVNTLASLDGRFSVAYQKAQLLEDGTRKFTDAQIKSNMAEARANLEKKNGVKFSDQQYKALLRTAEMATKSAQDVKTLGQVFDIAKETIGSGWAASFNNIFGNLAESKKLFTEMSNGLGDLIRKNALARNEMLASWKEGGGRAALIEGLEDAFKSVLSVLGSVKDAFRTVFPAKTATDLINLSKSFADFMTEMRPSEKTLNNLRTTFTGVFSILKIGTMIIGAVFDQVQRLLGALGDGSGDFLEFTAHIGRQIYLFQQMLEQTGLITGFFELLGNVISVPLNLLGDLAGAIGRLFSGFGGGQDAIGQVDRFGNALGEVADIGQVAETIFRGIGRVIGNVTSAIAEGLGNLGAALQNAITADTFSATLDTINTALLGGIVLMLRKFFSGGVNVDIGAGGMFDSIGESLSAVTGQLTAMQTALKADILLKIAAAVAILTASMVVLASIDGPKLVKAMTAMGVGMGILGTTLVLLATSIGIFGAAKLPFIAAAMVGLASAMLILAVALKIYETMDLGDMARGLFGVAGMLFILQKAMTALAGTKSMLRTAASLSILSVGLLAMGVALKIFASISWEEMLRGLAALGGTLAVLAVAMKIMPPMENAARELLILGAALAVMGLAMKIFATMSWDEMIRGMVALTGTLIGIAAAMRLMPKRMLFQSVALMAIAGAITVLAGALKIMGSMSGGDVAKSLIALGGSLLILAIGLNAMGPMAILGAAALTIAAAALALFVPVLITLGTLSWGTILKALGTLALTFGLLGVSGMLLAPVVPVLMGLGAALILIGAGFALAGVGAMGFATAFGIFVAAGAAGIELLLNLLQSVVMMIPKAMIAFAKGLVGMLVVIANNGPKISRAFGRIISNILDAVIRNVPKFGRVLMVMLDTGLRVIVNMAPKIALAGLKLIVGFLEAVDSKIYRITTLAISIMTKFIRAIGDRAPKLVDEGAKTIVKLVNGMAAAIDNNSEELGRAGGRLAWAMMSGMVKGINAMAEEIADSMIDVAKDALDAALDFIKPGSPSKVFDKEVGQVMGAGVAQGIRKTSRDNELAGREVARTALRSMQKTLSEGADISTYAANRPRITPVLDLTQVRREAVKMEGILSTPKITPSVSYAQASDISNDTRALQEAILEMQSQPPSVENNFTQNNYSPKALPASEIYRNTRSLFAITKGELES